MSWLRQDDDGDDDGEQEHGQQHDRVLPLSHHLLCLQEQQSTSSDTLATRLRELQALLASERESHSQCREALSVSRLNEKEALYRVGPSQSALLYLERVDRCFVVYFRHGFMCRPG